MKKKESARTCHINVVVTPEEHARLRVAFSKTTYGFFSEYVRTLLLRKPVTIRYRDASLDEFLPVAHQIKNELEEIGRQFTQTVKSLQSVSAEDAGQALQFLLSEEIMLKHTIEQIRLTLIKIYENVRNSPHL